MDKGVLSKGYIYIKASMNGGSLTQWESISIIMNGVGGHLFRPQSLPTPNNEKKTELLYALNYISLTDIPYNEQNTPHIVNWFELFNEGNTIEVYSFISSLRPALIDEISIYYQCAKDSDCLLTLR